MKKLLLVLALMCIFNCTKKPDGIYVTIRNQYTGYRDRSIQWEIIVESIKNRKIVYKDRKNTETSMIVSLVKEKIKEALEFSKTINWQKEIKKICKDKNINLKIIE